jgi:hypothetical protein
MQNIWPNVTAEWLALYGKPQVRIASQGSAILTEFCHNSFTVPVDKFQSFILNQATAAFFHIFSNLLFINILTINAE